MSKTWVLGTAILIFFLFTFLFWRFTSGDAKKGYGKKMWRHWPTQLAYWQAAIFYSAGFTLLAMFLLKWGNVLSF